MLLLKASVRLLREVTPPASSSLDLGAGSRVARISASKATCQGGTNGSWVRPSGRDGGGLVGTWVTWDGWGNSEDVAVLDDESELAEDGGQSATGREPGRPVGEVAVLAEGAMDLGKFLG